jgi:AcrR family transcriptional regulator
MPPSRKRAALGKHEAPDTTPGSARRRSPKPSPAPRRDALSRSAIADAALAQIDEQGLEALSMRKLGEALGVEAMALYHHYPNKGELLDAVMDRLVEEIDQPDAPDATPLQRLRRYVADWRGIALRHPRAYPLLAMRRFNSARSFAMYERILGAFADAGLPPERAARWFRLIGGFATGAGLAEVASREQAPDATPLRLEHAPDSVQFPHVRAAAPHLRVERLDGVFEFGLDVLFDALARELAAGAAPSTAKGRKRGAPR